MIDVIKLAHQAGIVTATSRDSIENFHKFAALHREAVIAELMEGVGEPVTIDWDENHKEFDCYTADQLAAAVARERAHWHRYLLDNFGLEVE